MPVFSGLYDCLTRLEKVMIPENLSTLFATHVTFAWVVLNNVIIASIIQEEPVWGIGVCAGVGMTLSWVCLVIWDLSYPIYGHVVSFSDMLLVYMMSLVLSIAMYTLTSLHKSPAPVVFTTSGLIAIFISVICVWRASYQPNCKRKQIKPSQYRPSTAARAQPHIPQSGEGEPSTITFAADTGSEDELDLG